MTAKSITVLAMSALVLLGLGVASAQAEPFAFTHPRQAEVIGRAQYQMNRVRDARAEGEIGPYAAHRMIRVDRQIIHQDRRMARVNGGYITRGQFHALNHQENRLGRYIPS